MKHFPSVPMLDLKYLCDYIDGRQTGLNLANAKCKGNRTVDDNVVVAKGVVPFLHMANTPEGREYCRCMVSHQGGTSTRTVWLVYIIHKTNIACSKTPQP